MGIDATSDWVRAITRPGGWCGDRPRSKRRAGILIAGLGVALALTHGYHVVAHEKPLLAMVIGALVPLGVSLLLVYAGYWTITSPYRLSYVQRILRWTFLGSVAMGALLGTIGVHQQLAGQLPEDAVFQLATALAGGGIAGFVLGVYDAHAQRRSDRFETLQRSTNVLVDESTIDGVCDRVTQITADELDLPLSGVWLHDDSSGTLEPVAATPEAQEMIDEQPAFDPGDALAWEAFENGRELLVTDVHNHDGRYNPETVVRSELIFPLGDHGVLIAASDVPGAFDTVDVETARLLAATVETVLDRVGHEQQLCAKRRELEAQNDRLEEFASVVSHDLRNPLNVARGYLEELQERVDDPSLDEIKIAHDRMETLVDELLSLSRAGRTIDQREPVPLTEVAVRSWQLVDTESATLELPEDRLTIAADRSRLCQLLENLFRNAVEHGGDSPAVSVGPLESRDGFYVADDGPGIPPGDREAIFERGYTTRTDGSGLGLLIVARIAEAHDWSIIVTESESGGARFEFDVSRRGS
ncbi:ATP-binding protein [Natrialba swarupiae]|uniref:histidine kinase n=1 Tax=Natrialba swarupiae TaxID=2448032 RepID=A0A5D5ALN3_9EURY|nr:ATP-binding protein [Natrialba swarupiae]TYT61757.1 GAF domain-containing protein [Natrialba swarupiae]